MALMKRLWNAMPESKQKTLFSVAAHLDSVSNDTKIHLQEATILKT